MNETQTDPNAPGLDYSSPAILTLAQTAGAFRNRFRPDSSRAQYAQHVSAVLATNAIGDDATVRLCRENADESGPDWIRCGSVAVPSSPAGVETLRRLRLLARDFMRRRIDAIAQPETRLAAISNACEAYSGSILTGLANVTKPESDGIRLRFNIQRNALEGLPRGEKPKPILTAPLVGRTFDGDDIESWRSHADACMEGTTEFLRRINVDFETDGGSSCGCGECDCDSGDEGDEITWCADFELDEKTVRLLDRAGYGDQTRDFFECGDGGSWEDVAGLDDAERAERIAPAPMVSDGDEIVTDEHGRKSIAEKKREAVASYDPKRFRFEACFELDGLESVGFSDVAVILPELVRMVDACQARGILPPIGGMLKPIRERYGSPDTLDESRAWSWEPNAGTLTHKPSSAGLAIAFDVTTGTVSAMLPAGGRTMVLADDFEISIPSYDCGDVAASWAGIFQGTVSL